MEIHAVEVSDTHIRATLEALCPDFWSYIHVIVAIFEVSRFDKVGYPLRGVMVLLAASHLITMPFFNVFNFLSPAVNFNISVHDRVLLSNYSKLRV